MIICLIGDLHIAKQVITQEGVDSNWVDEEGNVALHYLCEIEGFNKKEGLTQQQRQMVQKKVQIFHFLLGRKNLRLEDENNDGDTPLHWAANSYNRRMSLLLIINGANHLKKNTKGEIPGDGGKIEMKMLNRRIHAENKCFGKLPDMKVKKLTEIFDDIDMDNTKSITHAQCSKFNAWQGAGKKVS